MPKPSNGWTLLGVLSLIGSFLCFAPTFLTFGYLVVSGIWQVSITLIFLLEDPRYGVYGFLWATAISMVYGLVVALPISVCSVTLHPVGGALAMVAARSGASRTGRALGALHLLTFCLGAVVLAVWLLLIAAGQLGF